MTSVSTKKGYATFTPALPERCVNRGKNGTVSAMTTINSESTALGHLKVVELGGGTGASAMAGRLLGDMGTDVVLVEPPGGVGARSIGPFANDIDDPDRSLTFLDHNINKRSVVLDIDSQEGQEAVRRLASWADVLIESYEPGYLPERGLGYEDLAEINPELVYGSLTPVRPNGAVCELRIHGTHHPVAGR